MRLLTILVLLSAATAAPISKDSDDLVKNSWSARNLNNRVPDADEQVKNSWSARNVAVSMEGVAEHKLSARSLEDRVADADEKVKNSWSARAVKDGAPAIDEVPI